MKLLNFKVKINIHNVLKNFAGYCSINFTSALLSFLQVTLIVRYISKIDYGYFAMFQVFQVFLVPIIGMNLSGAISRKYIDGVDNHFFQYVSNCIFISVATCLLSAVIFYIFSGFFTSFLSLPHTLLYEALIISFGQGLLTYALAILQMQDRLLLYAFFQIGRPILYFTLIIFYVIYWNHLNWQCFAFLQMLSYLLILFCIFIFMKNFFVAKINFKIIKEAIKFGAPLTPHMLSGWITVMAGRIIVKHQLGLAAVALYAVGFQFGMIIDLIQTSLGQAWNPWLFKQISGENPDKLKIVQMTYIGFLSLIITTILFLILFRVSLTFILPISYINCFTVVAWIAFSYCFKGMYTFVAGYIFYNRQTFLLSCITFSVSALLIFLMSFMASINGVVGVAQAVFLASGISFLLVWLCAARLIDMPWLGILKRYRITKEMAQKG